MILSVMENDFTNVSFIAEFTPAAVAVANSQGDIFMSNFNISTNKNTGTVGYVSHEVMMEELEIALL